MAIEEYKNKKTEFCFMLMKIIVFLPPIMLLLGLCFYFIGDARSNYIDKYNRVAEKWVSGRMDRFKENSFYLGQYSGPEVFRNVTHPSENQYPVEDTCDKEGDPAEGCIYSASSFFDITVIVFEGDVVIRLLQSDKTLMGEMRFPQSRNITKTPKELGCTYQINECKSPCEEEKGTWNSITELCTIQLYVSQVCYRLKEVREHVYAVDSLTSVLPQNQQFTSFVSDHMGCTYNNNWNSAVYSKDTSINQIHVHLKSTEDAYIAASAYTRGCSSDMLGATDCFGETRKEERNIPFLVIWISVGLVIVEIIGYITTIYAAKVKHQKAVAMAQQASKENDIYLLS